MKKTGRRLSALMSAVAVLMSSAMAATVYTGDYQTDLWTEAIYTDQVRIYGSGTYRTNYEWPGTSTLRNAGYPSCLLEADSLSVDEVFGSECSDLLYTDPTITTDSIAYMKDGDRLLTNYQMAEWNGFLFVLTGGYKTSLTTKSVTGETGLAESYEVAQRSDTSGMDSYLYVFDISNGEHYSTARYAKWSISDLGFSGELTHRYMEGIAVDDNCIYILTNNAGSASDKYARSIAAFKNTVKRGSEAVIPTRIDAETDDYKYGAKEIIPASMIIANSQTFTSYAVGNGLISFSNYELNLATPSTAKAAAGIWATPIGSPIGETKVYYSSESYAAESNSAKVSLAALLKCSAAESWSSVDSPVIRDITVNSDKVLFLVTYSLSGTYYKQIFVTDWSDINNPVLLGDVSYADTDAQAADSPTFTGRCYAYEDYIYVSSIYGVETIKMYDDNNNFALSYNSKLDLSSAGADGYMLRLAVCGDYLYGWVNKNQNIGFEVKAKLSADKTAAEECSGKQSARRDEGVIVYGGRIYTQWAVAGVGDAARQSCVYVADTNKLMPVSLRVDYIEDEINVPYVITGTGHNIEAVKVIVNGTDMGYIKAADDGSGTDKWQYTVNEPGEYTIEFIGASMEGYSSEGTTETVDFTAYAKDGVIMTASYAAEGDVATVTVNITNTGEKAVDVVPVAGLYADLTMESLAFGEKITVNSGETVNETLTLSVPLSAVSYKIKTFLIDGLDTIAPITEAVEN